MRSLNDFNTIAKNYDWLSRLVYRKTLINAQVRLLPYVPEGAHILIAGGGTGWILEELTRVHPGGLMIDYVEMSAEMIRLARKRKTGNNMVNFFRQDISSFSSGRTYDIIFTAFFFDSFPAERGEAIFIRLNEMLGLNGKWLFVDFVQEAGSPVWQKWLLKLMYAFFRFFCNIETTELADMRPVFKRNAYASIACIKYLHGFIRSVVYMRQ